MRRTKRMHYRTRAYSNGYTEYSNYLEWLEKIFGEVLRVTKPGGFCGIIIGTVLLNGKHYPVPFDLISRLTQKGWGFHQDIVWHKCTTCGRRVMLPRSEFEKRVKTFVTRGEASA